MGSFIRLLFIQNIQNTGAPSNSPGVRIGVGGATDSRVFVTGLVVNFVLGGCLLKFLVLFLTVITYTHSHYVKKGLQDNVWAE
jgi:hypothetical protein